MSILKNDQENRPLVTEFITINVTEKKMKKNMIYMAALAMMTAACSNDDDTILTGGETGWKMITETITATDGDGSGSTRAAVDANAAFTWTAGDQVAVHVSDGKYYTTTALTTGGSNTADFTVTYPDGQSRNVFAVFPANIVAATAANYGQSGTTLDVTLPGSYNIAMVSGNATPCPMIANNTGSGWTFKQLCGMLRLTVSNIPAEAVSLKIDFNDRKVQGTFSIASPVAAGTSTIATTATDDTDDIITINGLNGSATTYNINLPLPTGDYSYVNVTAYDNGNAPLLATTCPMKASSNYTAQRAKGRKVSASLMPTFSVSETQKVCIAPGNLQATTADGSTWTWRFAANQWDYIGNVAANNTISGNGTSSAAGTIDLFGWSTPATYYGIHNTKNGDDYTGDFKEWGENISNSWHTMSYNEWAYLIVERTNGSTVNGISNAHYTLATINTDGTGVNGLIIFPDNVTFAADEATPWGTIDSNSNWTTKCTTAQWAALAAKGCVFLPAAGFRVQGITVDQPGSNVYYWTSSVFYYDNNNSVSNLIFTADIITSYSERYFGNSVRLVRNL